MYHLRSTMLGWHQFKDLDRGLVIEERYMLCCPSFSLSTGHSIKHFHTNGCGTFGSEHVFP